MAIPQITFDKNAIRLQRIYENIPPEEYGEKGFPVKRQMEFTDHCFFERCLRSVRWHTPLM